MKMRDLIHVDMTQPQPLTVRLGPGVGAYAYGSVVKGTATADSDLDVYVSGPRAAKVEERYALRRPMVKFQGATYPLHVVGPNMVDEVTFLEAQPEAQRVL
jgi:predicted nucleotidyltransferase